MVDHLPPPDKEHPDPRAEMLDDPLGVEDWPRPGREAVGEIVEGAPSWWRGEEEASASFLRSMGVDVSKLNG
jgi:hypothetical protein